MKIKTNHLIPQLFTICLLLSNTSASAAEDVPSAEKDGLKIEIKCVEAEIDITQPLAVEVTLTNTSDEDMKLLGIKGMKLTVYSADGKTYMEAPNANQAMTTGFYMPIIKAGESRVETRKIKLDRLKEFSPKGAVSLQQLKGNQLIQLEAGQHTVSIKPYFRAFSHDSADPRNKGLYVGSPGSPAIAFTLKETK